MRTCPHCGQTLPERDAIRGVVVGGNMKKALNAIHRAGKEGIDTEAILERVLASNAEGGPASGTKLVHVWVCALNKRLYAVGKRIVCDRSGIGPKSPGINGRYRIVDLGDGRHPGMPAAQGAANQR